MKKLLFSVLAIGAFTVGNAQEMAFGVKAGVNFSNFSVDEGSTDGRTGFYVGALVDLPISETFHVQPEVLFSQEGADDASLSYIRIPIMAKYYVMEGLSLLAGPSIAFKVAAENDFMDEATKSMDIGVGIGAAYEFPMGLFVDARYNLGVSNISEFDGGDIKNTNFQIGIGYRF